MSKADIMTGFRIDGDLVEVTYLRGDTGDDEWEEHTMRVPTDVALLLAIELIEERLDIKAPTYLKKTNPFVQNGLAQEEESK